MSYANKITEMREKRQTSQNDASGGYITVHVGQVCVVMCDINL